MFKVKGQDGGVYEVEKIYPRQYITYAKTHYFIMGDNDILGVFESEKNSSRILKNFLAWYSSPTTNTTIFTIAQDDKPESVTKQITSSSYTPRRTTNA